MTRVSVDCKICSCYIGSANMLTEHISHHFKVSLFLCEICQHFSGRTSEDLHYHVRHGHGGRPYKFLCPVCKQFESWSVVDIGEHVLTKKCITVKSMYFCLLSTNCSFICTSPTGLFQHFSNLHFPQVTVTEICTDCTYESSDSHALYQHMRDKHSLDYDSDECEYSVQVKCNLCVRYVCERKRTYIRHMNAVHPQFYYNCPYRTCDFKTNIFWELSDHMFEEHFKTVFTYNECTECDVGFAQQQSLKQHLFDKHGIEDYCSVCDSYWDGLVSHLVQDHEMKFSLEHCRICSHKCDDDDDLLDHLATEHNIHILKKWGKIY